VQNTKIMKKYLEEVKLAQETCHRETGELLTDDDIKQLPQPIQKYMYLTGVIGKPKPFNVKVVFEGKIRSGEKNGWMTFKSEQYNFFDEPTRIFYIEARKMGIPAKGIHLYKHQKAIMVIKLAGLFNVVDAKGPEMDQGETVTVFNDMCLLAPASLISKNIKWEEIDSTTVKARFTNGDITISAQLYFNENGELINFISYDRFETADGIHYFNYPWSTPILEYREINGYKLASTAQTIFHRPDHDFCYGTFNLINLEYNAE
jgi:hypothetical protein